jgi:hypothetical protein
MSMEVGRIRWCWKIDKDRGNSIISEVLRRFVVKPVGVFEVHVTINTVAIIFCIYVFWTRNILSTGSQGQK